MKYSLGLVIIGRNEGERLRRCLLSVMDQRAHVVYVDSGSSDGSVEYARSLGAAVVELDQSTQFTAARARNTGFFHLKDNYSWIEYVQFVDGDCEVVQGWLEQAKTELESKPDVAIVCGRRRERFPKQSIYNQLCDLEWDTPIGETKSCGGDALMRVDAFEKVDGFNPQLIAGEEPELCFRLRQLGWKILRLDTEMTLHDAQITEFYQWWKRTLRSGYAYTEGAWLHGRSPERYWVKESRSIMFWGAALPTIIIGGLLPSYGFSLILLMAYPLLILKIYRSSRARGFKSWESILYAVFCMLSKFPQAQGQLQWYWKRILGQSQAIVEYKILPKIAT